MFVLSEGNFANVRFFFLACREKHGPQFDTYVCVTSGVSPMKEFGNLSNQISHSSQLPVQQ